MAGEMEKREAKVRRAVTEGLITFLNHCRENGKLPNFPSWLKGGVRLG
jgi:hypothetical protein